MIRRAVLVMCAMALSIVMRAAKANSLPVVVTQADGTRLTVILHGDEYASWYTTLDGALLVQDQDGYYIANVSQDGVLTASRQLAHEPLLRGQAERNLVLKQNHKVFFNHVEPLLAQGGSVPVSQQAGAGGVRRLQVADDATLFPHTGSPKALVILAEFSDTTFTLPDPKASFTDYLNNDSGNIPDRGYGENHNPKGIRGYFKDISFGHFIPQFDVVGPVRLPNPLRYYGADGNGAIDANYKYLIIDACKAVDDSVDFSQYDANNDGKVDLVYIIYAGHSQSESGNSSNDLWPKSGARGDFGSFDGKQIYRYGINNEINGNENRATKLINGIGLFCHEFSHCMGLPDIYATSGSVGYNKDNFGMEYWDLMDGGEYVNSGRYPTAYTAWEREVMGWMTVDTLSDTTHVVMSHIDKGDTIARAYKILNDTVHNEAFYLQNIQQKRWNSSLPGHGLFVYRVSYANDVVNVHDRPNSGTRPRIIPVPADGNIMGQGNVATLEDYNKYLADMAGDTYPGTTGRDSIPYFITYDSAEIAKPVFHIVENSDGIVSFDYLGERKSVDAISGLIATIPSNSRIYTIYGRYAGTDVSRLPKGVYIVNRKKIIVR